MCELVRQSIGKFGKILNSMLSLCVWLPCSRASSPTYFPRTKVGASPSYPFRLEPPLAISQPHTVGQARARSANCMTYGGFGLVRTCVSGNHGCKRIGDWQLRGRPTRKGGAGPLIVCAC